MGEGSSDERSEVAGQPRSAEWMHLPVNFEELLRGTTGYEVLSPQISLVRKWRQRMDCDAEQTWEQTCFQTQAQAERA